jgi:hypothetical protein
VDGCGAGPGEGDAAGGVDDSVVGGEDGVGAGFGVGVGCGDGLGCGCGDGFGLGFGVRGGVGAGPEPPGPALRLTLAEVATTTCVEASDDACLRRGGTVRRPVLAGFSLADGCVGPNVIVGSGATCGAGTAAGVELEGSSAARQR